MIYNEFCNQFQITLKGVMMDALYIGGAMLLLLVLMGGMAEMAIRYLLYSETHTAKEYKWWGRCE
jgi:hypothetical protein